MGWSDSPSHRRQRRRACNGCHCRVQEQARSQYRRGSRVVHQISLFVIPLLVVLGWIIGKPLSLLFDPFESIVLFLSVLLA